MTPVVVSTAAVATVATAAGLALSAPRHVVEHLSLAGVATRAIRRAGARTDAGLVHVQLPLKSAPAAGLVQLQYPLTSKTDRLGEVTVVVVLHVTLTLAAGTAIRCADVAVVAVARLMQVLQVMHPNASCVLHANVILRDATLTAGGGVDVAAPAIRCAAMTAAVGLMPLLRLHPPAQRQDPLHAMALAMALLLLPVPATQFAVTRYVVPLCKVAE